MAGVNADFDGPDRSSLDMSRALRPQRPDVIDEEFEGEAVLVQLGTGCYYALNPSASVVWRAFADGRSPGAVADGLAVARDELAAFVSELVAEQLLHEADADAGPPQDLALPDGADAPSLQRFTDMQDLLMLDPIHDINLDGDGWPVVPEKT